jgi:hypothetical protein
MIFKLQPWWSALPSTRWIEAASPQRVGGNAFHRT